ncbi:U6 snRNA-associated Sm-like protein LSm8 [Entomortierella parvispora]|uniref:LSM2-LSM8 complex subunit LSM8 n=1 Tax=Entomortierella parvispora TaxID=205924 RepID=A0A9P3M143_9FUNG|nr:U6 snRNA-associated Sm-like protein LSm8 [Entomortierella parvispora]
MSDLLKELVDKPVFVYLTDGRTLVGQLTGYDQAANVILSQTHERIFSSSEGMKSVPIGVYVVRGETIALIGGLDEELDEGADWENVRVEPLDPVFL